MDEADRYRATDAPLRRDVARRLAVIARDVGRSASYECLGCGHTWRGQPGPVTCPACGHEYVRWVDYPARSWAARRLERPQDGVERVSAPGQRGEA